MSYDSEAQDDALNTIEHFGEQIAQDLFDNGEASDDLFNDYPDGDAYHHENHVDKYYDLSDAVEVLKILDEYEETDSGLWEGQQLEQAIGTKAALTYGRAVYFKFQELIADINAEFAEKQVEDESFPKDLDAVKSWLEEFIAGHVGWRPSV